MHPEDEINFYNYLMEDESVELIDGPRWAKEIPECSRSIENIGDYCIIWSPKDYKILKARYIPTCNDWYCESEYATIQWLRSSSTEKLFDGRIAISTNELGHDFKESQAKQVEKRFKSLRSFIKKSYTNSVIRWLNINAPISPASPKRSSNPSKPDKQLWVGPEALKMLIENSNVRVHQKHSAIIQGLVGDAEC